MKDELILFTSLETNFRKSNSDYLNLTFHNVSNDINPQSTKFLQIGNLNYKFKRKSKNFFYWLLKVKNIHYNKTEGAII